MEPPRRVKITCWHIIISMHILYRLSLKGDLEAHMTDILVKYAHGEYLYLFHWQFQYLETYKGN